MVGINVLFGFWVLFWVLVVVSGSVWLGFGVVFCVIMLDGCVGRRGFKQSVGVELFLSDEPCR